MVYTDFERKAEHWRALADRRLIALHEQERAIARLRHKVGYWRRRAETAPDQLSPALQWRLGGPRVPPLVTVEEYGFYLDQVPNAEIPLDWDRQNDSDAPVVGVSANAADAYASWCGGRLLTEQEWQEYAEQGMIQPIQDQRTGYWLWEWTATTDDGARVLRGGSLFNLQNRVRCASRYGYNPNLRYWYNGFRVVAP